ncbi:MAG TPA: recombinase family protein [Candidatus Paceibacterota bacterium]|nr:recombinase family protein [Verrucomicrobiota bacterium]HSA09823.1 recombinase family protein [Candidatus Paceibacterota bacterium]
MKTAVYLRVSTAKGTQKTDSQEYEVKRYCSARGWKDLEIYVDKLSGGKTSRPALDRMVKDMRDGKIARVVVFKLDRCGRSLTHLCLLIDEMNRLGVPLICTSQGIDTSENNPCAKFQLDVLKAVCEFERNLIRERVNAGLAAARAKGVRLGRPKTLQWRREDVLELRKQGKGIREIARELKMPVASVFKVVKEAK